jgi:prophage regulatory protein
MTTEISLIRINKVLLQTGLARSTIYKLISVGEFPQPVKITSKSSAWVSTEVDDWKLSRMKERKLVH